MELFRISRYTGEEDSAVGNSSQALLEQLREQARARQLKKQQQEELSPSGEFRLKESETKLPEKPKSRDSGLDSENQSQRETKKKKRKQSDKDVCAEGPKKLRKNLKRGNDSDEPAKLADSSLTAEAAQEHVPLKKKKRNNKKTSVVSPKKTEADPEENGEQEQKRNNLKRRQTQRRKKMDLSKEVKADGAEMGEEGSGEVVNGNQGGNEQLSTAGKEKATPPPSSLKILGGYDKKAIHKIQPILPQWLAQPKLVHKRIKENLVPIQDVPGIHPRLLKKLQVNGVESFFPVQVEVIPAILEGACNGFLVGRGGYQPSDICVSAPTGSGKTLSFIIPVVQTLLERAVCQVRALAVLPTKELAQQVSRVFNIYTDGTGLKVVLITGQKSFAKEQEALVQRRVMGYSSLADIVVATPGRLVDHIDQTPGFSLRQLRFLIIDEADRMIDDIHQNWLRQVVKAAFKAEEDSASSVLFQRTEPGPVTAASLCCPQIPLQKLLFSATLTRNPEKLQQLGLYQPRLFTSVYSKKQASSAGPVAEQNAEKKYTLPEGLSQYYVPCNLNSKPLFLLHFMLTMKFTRVLCFTNSKETSHRLFLLVRAFGGVNVAEFSSRLTPSERQKTLKVFEQGKIQLLISTDATARGIDIKGVKYVINYDAPQYIRAYIHRVGRTARAGRVGLAFTMLLKVQEQKFLQMLRDAGFPELGKQLVKSEYIKSLLERYEEALSQLQKTVKDERAQKRA
ncbi:PREDICTED: ATP-dependent RNA helicase DDX51 isoform X2 [Crocodylus porosus]|uniref:ATP-dependent RNA helicase n=1 Tax=Crocodylus porosus TaxID=8502 RepID=A0A7M4DZU5_CROPO|nr:PREDICTED: ATP-dependent RNA helicase DDX51 isoform X2 [Crocodylus porosus]